MPKVSVISPVYKVERFIERAVDSMMKQTLRDIEFIFVDDASPDNSIAILKAVIERFPERATSVRILTHTKNLGLPAARNTGLVAATGDFVFHWDSDDYADCCMLEKMYSFAVNNDLDIVWADWFLTFAKNERYMSQPDYLTPENALRGMLGGGMKYNVWNKLVKRKLFINHSVFFPYGYGMGEDMTMMLLFLYAKKVGHLPEAYYHYLKTNTEAFSHKLNDRYFHELLHNVRWISEQIKQRSSLNLNKEIAYLKLQSKYPLLVASGDFNNYRLWSEWFPEANEYIFDNKSISFRSRMVQFMALYKLYWAVWLHYVVVCKVIYGIIYH